MTQEGEPGSEATGDEVQRVSKWYEHQRGSTVAFREHPGAALSEPVGSLATVVSYFEVLGAFEKVLVRLQREPDKVRWFYDVQLKALQEAAADEPLSPPLPESLTPSPGLAARNVGLWQKQPGAGVPGALGLAGLIVLWGLVRITQFWYGACCQENEHMDDDDAIEIAVDAHSKGRAIKDPKKLIMSIKEGRDVET